MVNPKSSNEFVDTAELTLVQKDVGDGNSALAAHVRLRAASHLVFCQHLLTMFFAPDEIHCARNWQILICVQALAFEYTLTPLHTIHWIRRNRFWISDSDMPIRIIQNLSPAKLPLSKSSSYPKIFCRIQCILHTLMILTKSSV